MTKQPITISDKALEQVKELLNKNNDSYGIRISLKSKGCNGLAYYLEYASSKNQFDEEVIFDGVKILIDSKALMFLIGTQMDYVDEKIESGFKFINPNEKGKCGCGKSFRI